jgi:anti-sigma regulatory factor (Ser/Thr protein kinase)
MQTRKFFHRMSPDYSELGRLCELVRAFGKENSFSDKVLFNVVLTIEELVSNMIKYGTVEGAAHTVEVSLEIGPKSVKIEIEDDGKPFNPLSVLAPDLDCPAGEREPGGLGIFLVCQFAEAMLYEKRADKNLTVVVKRL